MRLKNISKFVLVFLLFASLFVFKGVKDNAFASDGTAELRSTTVDDYRCFVFSFLQTNGRYNVNISCVDLLYPPRPPDVNVYMLWGTPLSGDNPVKIGELGVGKAEFDVRNPFGSLFVTVEENDRVRTPGPNRVMEGRVEPVQFLERPQSPTPTPEPVEGENGETIEDEEEVDTSQLSTRQKLVLAFRRAGIAALLALIAIVGLIFVVTRSRG